MRDSENFLELFTVTASDASRTLFRACQCSDPAIIFELNRPALALITARKFPSKKVTQAYG